jgi:hypothetical protein
MLVTMARPTRVLASLQASGDGCIWVESTTLVGGWSFPRTCPL